jgi:DNA-binding transcriptional ArsR family regulator
LLGQGVDGLLSNLHHSIRWSNPTLAADYPYDHSIDLAGRGLTLVPAHFCWGAPVTFIDGELMPVLVYPADGGLVEIQRASAADRLGRLIGGTRARLLAEVELASSTTRLAHQLNISAPAVSQHIGVLRAAGLVCTTRTGLSVRHALTPLGRDLLAGDSTCWRPGQPENRREGTT